MPEYLRSLIFILVVSSVTFAFAKKTIGPLLQPQQFNRWRNAWLAITIIAFMSQNFWVYIVVSGILLMITAKREPNAFGLFFVLLFTVPMIGKNIPAFGVINFLFNMNYLRLLSLAILLPAFLSLRSQPGISGFGKNWPDRLLFSYLILNVLLNLRDTSFSDAMRFGFYQFTDVFLPYYVASRGIKNLDQLKEVMIAFVLACFLLAALGMVEFAKHWLLYNSLQGTWGIVWDMVSYLNRGQDLRALTTLGQPIVLGYVMAIGLGFYLLVAQSIPSKAMRFIGLMLVLAGLYVPLSRGPWVGAAALLVIYIATGPNAMKRLAMLGVAAILSLPILHEIPGGEKIINLIPFVGTTEVENIDYRERLIDNSLIVIKRNLLFGSSTYREEPEMQAMIQGEGIIDIVNSFIGIALESGIVGLSLFVGFFTLILLSIFKTMRKIPGKKIEAYLLGRTLFACLIGILVTIITVSSIVVIPIVYWSVAGLGVAYTFIIRKQGSNTGKINNPEKPELSKLPTSRLGKQTGG